MKRRVLRSKVFIAGVRDDLAHLERIDRVEWLDLLEEDIAAIEELIGTFPRAGKLIDARQGKELRQATLHHVPFLLWYAFEPGRRSGPVTLLRLFHQRQRRPPRKRW